MSIKKAIVLDCVDEGIFSLVRENGYNGVELNIKFIYERVPFEKILDLKDNYNIEVVALGTGKHFVEDKLSLSDKDKKIRDRCIEILKRYIDFCERIGSNLIIGLIRGNLEKREDINYFIDSLKEVIEYGEKREVTVLLEPINRYETNFLNRVEEGVEIVERLNSSYLKLLVDTFHMNIEEEERVEKVIEKYRDYIGHIHFSDSKRVVPWMKESTFDILSTETKKSFFPWEKYKEDREKLLSILNREIDFREIFSTLKRINYNGYISLEVLYVPDLRSTVKEGGRFFKALFG